ncbi:MAG: hypothetical protein A2747_03255 [Candidatus Yonathbacteria bacterium RIFCSPHIGHO2_01_FULL_44_41]|uniref:Uncharacterized protein n=1 Tax=Candidatus Yonathbacteria bacterium RIFCSPHIGHO2_02_FULL_44_14 TaxID=1802724 RepID=A0A1G2S6Y6_9BACT|nr:MAG: hypothetical protein A2747_03255 [Candidatus Yonathbacteria bacterium RIFCSPHIGHO2_01_FULL_44_41]OHA80488.1 MAG: hypothetical protein A3D51_00145 [Candidatus Yonathbacteria bacterium RIFCSPHIGHO2_02_FULL_44_14]OHA82223.1 MAG: hypothetical protein A3B06_01860 [Candidatus Yonathbacteria bacterium RIFCSPLOWO2_01_FULL_43_20]
MNTQFHGQATNLLIRLRAKPSHIKQIISIVLTLAISSGILFVWVSSWDARSSELEVREKTVSPVDGVASMFGGFVEGLKERMSELPSFMEANSKTATTTPTDSFDLSGVVIIDQSATTTKATSTSAGL